MGINMKNLKSMGKVVSLSAIIIAVATVVLVSELVFMALLHEHMMSWVMFSNTTWDLIDAIFVSGIVSSLLYFLIFQQMRTRENFLHLINESATDAIIVIDEQARLAEWNKAAQTMFGFSRKEALGKSLHQLITPLRFRVEADRGFKRFQSDGEGPLIGKTIESFALRNDGSEFPVELSISSFKHKKSRYAIGIVRDISVQRLMKERMAILLSLAKSSQVQSLETLLQQGLDELQRMTASRIGFLHFINEDQNEIELVAWSSDTLENYCKAAFDKHYPISEAGIWVDSVNLKRPVIVNDYASAQGKKGLPEGHSEVRRMLSVPILENDKVRMIIGVGNAERAYDERDIETIHLVGSDLYHLAQSKRAAIAHKESLQHLQAITQSAGDAIISADEAGNVIGWNLAAERVFGYGEDEIMGQSLTLLIPEKFRKQHIEGLRRVVNGGEPHVIGHVVELAGLHKDGHEFPVELSLGKWGEVDRIFFTAILRDISDRKRDEETLNQQQLELQMQNDALRRTERVLRESREQYVDIYDNAPVGYLTIEIETNLILLANLTVFAMLGVGKDNFVKQKITSFILPEDQDIYYLLCREFINYAKPRDCELRMLRLDETQFWVNLSSSAMVDDSGRQIALVTLSDITERKQAEALIAIQLNEINRARQEWQAVFDSVTQPIFLHDDQYRVIRANQSYLEYAGMSLEQVIGQPYYEIFPKTHHPLPGCLQASQENDCGIDVEVVVGAVTYRSRSFRVNDEQGAYLYSTHTLEDITERKRSTQQLQALLEHRRLSDLALRMLNEELEGKVLKRTEALEQARHEAEQANQAKSIFLAAMSHEIRTPMNGVIGMVDVLQQSSLTSRQMEMANIIHDSAYSLLGIINDILDFSRIEAGKLQIDAAPMSIVEIVESVCSTMDHLSVKKKVELMEFTDPVIPSEVIGDASRLRQILINLINNAIKFSSGMKKLGKVSLRALLLERTVEQVTLEFRISDNGIGMDEATQAKLFSPFIQADSSTTRTYGGTGLGLAISRQLLDLMGGQISVQSEPDKGSVFIVHIAFKLPEAQPAATPSPVAGLICLIIGDTEMADDFAAYLNYDGALVERASNMNDARLWIKNSTREMNVVVIDALESQSEFLNELRQANQGHPEQGLNFVTVEHNAGYVSIERGQRREPRLMDNDWVTVDRNGLTHGMLLKAVAIAAGRLAPVDTSEQPAAAQQKIQPLSREEARRRGRLILVAEDNEINQKVVLQQLSLLGETADVVNDGQQALICWKSGDYALLLTDLHMPVMDGYQLTTAIRTAEQGNSHIPIVAFTANALKGEAEHCFATGMDDYLSKPVQLLNLKAMLNKWLSENVDQNLSRDVISDPVVETACLELLPSAAESLPVEVDMLRKLVGDDEEIIREFLHDFRLSAAKIAEELRAAFKNGNAIEAGALAHKLKSSSRSVGALALGEFCFAMEKTGKVRDLDALMKLLPEFEQELARVESYLQQY